MQLAFSRKYDVVVVSYGGAGTTFLADFLGKKLRTNSANSYHDGIKHANSPTHPALRRLQISRAIYVYDNPARAVYSLFRRDYQWHMIPKLKSEHANPREYKRYVTENARHISLGEFLALGEDLFEIERHWRRWNAGGAPFPIMMLKYDGIYDCIPEIMEFVGLPASAAADFPARIDRHSTLDALSPEEIGKFDAIYGRLAAEMKELPPVYIVPAAESPSVEPKAARKLFSWSR